MAGQDFQLLVDSGLLRQVEQIVVGGHRNLYESERRPWSPPIAYRWLRYENPTPVERLAEGVKRLRGRGVVFDSDAVEKACVEASKTGFLI
jgi:hypothetical protein